ncbi:MAG: hypothetical protein L6R37_002616 [Teloschistes peruensis]|nr:MAG: hypothetical protein L6R37_002616 [Teloschistes peruensis]
MQAKPGIPSHRNAVVGGGCGIHSLLDEAMTGVSTFDEARRGTQGGGHHWTRGPRISLARSYLIHTIVMTSKLSNALPARLQSGLSNGDAEGAFKQKHHGKSQSHVVSRNLMIVDRPESSDSFNRKMTYFKIKTQHTLLGCHSVESWWHVVSFYTIFRATK